MLPRACTDPARRFLDTEEWRKDTKLDEVVPDWEYPEKADVFKYYPQYYHKTDKVSHLTRRSLLSADTPPRTAAPSTSSSSAAST